MKYLSWSSEKNQKLKIERNICFEDIVDVIETKKILAVIKNPNQNKYPNQKILIVNINNYAYLIPYVEDEEKYFLKTIIPSRRATKKYILKNKNQQYEIL
ncbi:MAG: toxin [bacterium]